MKNAKLNEMDYSKNFITHDQIMKGGNLNFEMSETPNLKRGINKEDFPYSFSNELSNKK